jgi:hypothetical protein
MQRRYVQAALLLLLQFSTGCARQPGLFSEPNARAHVGMLAGTIGSRAVGTPANARARAYIVDQLHLFGFEVRVQEADARRASLGRSARVANIIATKTGRRPEAVGIVSHYDSVPAGPGAADDGLGVAVSLEAARVLGARSDRNWSLMILITDGEEASLMGAAALMTDRDVTTRLQTYVNLDAIGSAGPPMLFEVGPQNDWLVKQWARFAPRPRGTSIGTEVYRRLPNDTDFSILKLQDIPGLNFAAVGDSYGYHSSRDTVERLSPATVRQTGEQIVALVNALDGADITQRSDRDATFFDVANTFGLSYGPVAGWLLASAAFLLGIIAWVRVMSAVITTDGLLRWLLTTIWSIAGAAAVAASMAGATWGLRVAHAVYHPWYARPGRMFVLMLAVGITIGWGAARLGRWLPPRAHAHRDPALIWSVTLPFWIALASFALWLAPGAAYLWLMPLAATGLLLSILPVSSNTVLRMASVVVLAIAATLWVPNTIDMLYFVVAVFGRLPMVTPVFVYAAVIAAAGLMVAPPLIAAVASPRPLVRPSLPTAIGLLAIAFTAGFAYAAPAYTYDQPLRRYVRAVQAGDGAAIWEVASIEPGLDLAEGAPSGWAPQAGIPLTVTDVPMGVPRHPFVFRTTGPSLGPAPVAIGAFTLEPVAAGTEVAVSVVPRQPGLAVSFVLPAGVQPARSSLPGVLRQGRWTATYVAVPPEGIAFRASFGSSAVARLREIRIVATATGLNHPAWTAPAWLPHERVVWTADANWVLSPADLPIAPVPPLR